MVFKKSFDIQDCLASSQVVERVKQLAQIFAKFRKICEQVLENPNKSSRDNEMEIFGSGDDLLHVFCLQRETAWKKCE